MSVMRMLADMGPSLRVTIDGDPQWTDQDPSDDDFFPSGEPRFNSLDESSSRRHRSSWTEGFDEEDRAEGGQRRSEATGLPGGRRSLQTAFGFRRRMSPARLHVVSDVTRRHRSSSGGRRFSDTSEREEEQSGGQVQGQVRLLRLSRDATQPNSGSVSDLRGPIDRDDEEMDVLPALGALTGTRPRAFTCPDIKVMQRRTKIRLLHRPPTPTPGDEPPFNGLAADMERSCSLSNSGEIFAHNEEEDPLPVISET